MNRCYWCLAPTCPGARLCSNYVVNTPKVVHQRFAMSLPQPTTPTPLYLLSPLGASFIRTPLVPSWGLARHHTMQQKNILFLSCSGCTASQPAFTAHAFQPAIWLPSAIKRVYWSRWDCPRFTQVGTKTLLPGIFRWLKCLCVFRSICRRVTGAAERRKISYLDVTAEINRTQIIRGK